MHLMVVQALRGSCKCAVCCRGGTFTVLPETDLGGPPGSDTALLRHFLLVMHAACCQCTPLVPQQMFPLCRRERCTGAQLPAQQHHRAEQAGRAGPAAGACCCQLAAQVACSLGAHSMVIQVLMLLPMGPALRLSYMRRGRSRPCCVRALCWRAMTSAWNLAC